MSKNKQNVRWDSNLSFMLALIGSAVGLGNIWRFPYVAYTNGGGAFLFPYLVSILVVGIPFLFVEYGAGYKFKAGISTIAHRINKKYEYLGWFIQVSPFLILTYYVCVVAWDFIFVQLSFVKGWGANPENFFNTMVLQASSVPDGLLHLAIYVCLSLMVVWFVVWFISHRNLNDGIGRASKILTPLLFVMMAVIVLFSVTLPGAQVGIQTLFTPDWNAITNPRIWSAAVGQILFSLSIGMTITLSYASYLPDDTNIPKSALTVVLANCGFEIFTATGVFAILGFMSVTRNIPIDHLVTQGTGLAFIAFPEIFNVMGMIGYVIGPLFFLCLLFAGITSNIAIIEPLALSIEDKFNFSRSKAVSIICLAAAVISILYTTSYGSTLLGVVDTFTNQFGLLLNVLLEALLLGVCYGLDKFLPGINENATFLKLDKKWVFLITYILPVIVFVLWVNSILDNLVFVDTPTMIVQVILLLIMFILPLILTKARAYDDNF